MAASSTALPTSALLARYITRCNQIRWIAIAEVGFPRIFVAIFASVPYRVSAQRNHDLLKMLVIVTERLYGRYPDDTTGYGVTRRHLWENERG
jgi:hypothetical protein